MAKTITITIPDAPEKQEEVMRFLAEKGLVPPPDSPKKGKYAELVRQYREEEILTGHGCEVARLRKGFREDFAL